jgi:hypothetical protein
MEAAQPVGVVKTLTSLDVPQVGRLVAQGRQLVVFDQGVYDIRALLTLHPGGTQVAGPPCTCSPLRPSSLRCVILLSRYLKIPPRQMIAGPQRAYGPRHKLRLPRGWHV